MRFGLKAMLRDWWAYPLAAGFLAACCFPLAWKMGWTWCEAACFMASPAAFWAYRLATGGGGP